MVDFDEDELVSKSIGALNARLRVSKVYFKVETGEQVEEIKSKAQLETGEAFVRKDTVREETAAYLQLNANSLVRYDLIGKLVDGTGLTRKAVTEIMVGLQKAVFNQFSSNPEEFIIRASNIINEQKATTIIEHIAYDKLNAVYSTEIFTEPDLRKGKLGVNAIETKRHLYDYVIYDSNIERDLAIELEAHSQEVEVYVKLPRGFYIDTPLGKYNPDWAIAFYEGKVKHIYFVAETKGDMSSLELTEIEQAKAHCAREHFRAISGDSVVYDVVDSYDRLWELIRG